MKLGTLKWIFLGTLVAFFLILQYAENLLGPMLDTWYGRLMLNGVMLFGVITLFGWIFDYIHGMQSRLERQHRELETLHRAALDIYGDLSLDTVLQKVVDQARHLLAARYGAIAVLDDSRNLQRFLTSGIDDETIELIGAGPEGRGLLGVVTDRQKTLRIDDMSKDPRSAGFPPGHPEMTSLLAVPILCKGPFRGNLYVTDTPARRDFTEDDERSLLRFATEAAIAVDNAHLHQRIQSLAVAEERVRIAREMHDGMAQVLAYVNTKAQAVKEFLVRGKEEEASAQLEELATAARDVYTEVREGILALRTQLGSERSFEDALSEFVDLWQRQSGVEAHLELDGQTKLTPIVELQLLRIIQESLSNVRKHAEATAVSIVFRHRNRHLEVKIEDNGKGFSAGSRDKRVFPRFGLAIMNERAESIGGQLSLDSSPDKGTRIEVEIPLQ